MAHKHQPHTLALIACPTDVHEREDEKGQADGHHHAFQHRSEPSTIELFYDLFFVANLTTFTTVHEINDGSSLSSYVGFFCLLWFTWLQVVLFDVRFSVDSVFERICKALQFGVMTGFAVTGPSFLTALSEIDYPTFQAFSLILMASRIAFVLQYLSVIWLTKNYRDTRRPLLLIVVTLTAAAVIYLGLFFAFRDEAPRHQAYIGWYVTAVSEAIITFAISSRWPILSFRHTHLVKRAGLLTLIILGEGVIGVTKSISTIVSSQGWSPALIGQIICAVLIIYFWWMLYFDRVEDEGNFGTIRQQLWTFLHFPFHVGLVLSLEGITQLVIWRAAVEYVSDVVDQVENIFGQAGSVPDLESALNDTATTLLAQVSAAINKTLVDLGAQSNVQSNQTADDVASVLDSVITNLFQQDYNIYAPETAGAGAPSDPSAPIDDIILVFQVVYVYFMLATGLALAVLAVMFWFSGRRKGLDAILMVAVRLLIGLGIAALSAIAATDPFVNYLPSPWILPTVLLCFALVLVIEALISRHAWRSSASEHRSSSEQGVMK